MQPIKKSLLKLAIFFIVPLFSEPTDPGAGNGSYLGNEAYRSNYTDNTLYTGANFWGRFYSSSLAGDKKYYYCMSGSSPKLWDLMVKTTGVDDARSKYNVGKGVGLLVQWVGIIGMVAGPLALYITTPSHTDPLPGGGWINRKNYDPVPGMVALGSLCLATGVTGMVILFDANRHLHYSVWLFNREVTMRPGVRTIKKKKIFVPQNIEIDPTQE